MHGVDDGEDLAEMGMPMMLGMGLDATEVRRLRRAQYAWRGGNQSGRTWVGV